MTSNHHQIPPLLFAKDLFSKEQWRHIHALLDSLDNRQSLWLSGFLAARGQPVSEAEQVDSEAARIWIAYGSETGNCESLAHRLGDQLSQQRVVHEVVSLADVKPRSLARVNYLLVICSTHGDGDPPEPVTAFYEALMSGPPPKFADMRFAVLALGDSSYEQFCTAGKRIDEQLGRLGGHRLIDCCECDVDFEQPAKEWMARVLALLPGRQSGQSPQQAVPQSTRAAKSEAPTRNNPLSVEVLENIRLTNNKRAKAIHHLELLIEPGSLLLEPGDAVGVLPHNPPELVAAIMDIGGFAGDEPIVINQHAVPLVEALREHLDLSIPSSAFLKCWAEASASAKLREIVEAENTLQRQFLRSVRVIDILRENPGTAGAQAFADSLRPLQPRLYDVANEVTPETDELHLTVKDFRYSVNGSDIAGTASAYLLQLQPGESLRIYPHHNKRFRLPENSGAPLILVANGTGIAPLRAFIQHLIRQGRSQRDCWLLFQEASAEEDFLYQVDLQQAAARDILTYVDTLFTADQPARQMKDIFERRSDQLLDWLAREAHLYVCGEKEVLGHCEHELKILCERTGNTDLWKKVVADKRIHRNLY